MNITFGTSFETNTCIEFNYGMKCFSLYVLSRIILMFG